MSITPTDRKHLAALLGMLGSDHAGERAAAGLQAEAFRRQHGLTWEELLAGEYLIVPRVVYVDREVPARPKVRPSFQWRAVAFRACFWTAVVTTVLLILH